MRPQPGPAPDARRKLAPAVALLVAAVLGYALVLAWRPERTAGAAADDASEPPAPPAPSAAPEAVPSPSPAARPEPVVARIARNLHSRDPGEWQGMRVNLDRQALCSGKSSCGLAMACIEGRCGPCRDASDCADGEQCVLDHCVRSELVACSSRRDCNADELCILSGYSGGTTRNNERMRSYCLAGHGGRAQREGEHASALGPPSEALAPTGPASTIDVVGLQEEVRAHNGEADGAGRD